MAGLNVTVYGCGEVGRAHLATWSAMPGVEIGAVCDPDGRAAAQIAAEIGVPAFPDLPDALRAGQTDIVDICLGTGIDEARSALRSGAHVLLPASGGSSPEDLRSIAELAAQRERMVIPALYYRLHPLVALLKDLVDNDDIGAPILARVALSGAAARPDDPYSLRSCTLCALDLFRYIAGDPDRIAGFAHSGAMSAALATGTCTGTVDCALDSMTEARIELIGTAGACVLSLDSARARYLTADHPVWQTREVVAGEGLSVALNHCADLVRGLAVPGFSMADLLSAAELARSIETIL